MRSALLVSTYELGRQPFGLASAAAWLRAGGLDGRRASTPPRRSLRSDALGAADLIALSPADAHGDAAGRRRSSRRRGALNPSARICAFGLYAPLNAEWLASLGVDEVFGGEFEEDLAAVGRPTAAWKTGTAENAEGAEPRILGDLCGAPRLNVISNTMVEEGMT